MPQEALDRIENPVWEVYDYQRTVRLNVHYYKRRLASAVRWNFWLEFGLAVSASTTVISLFGDPRVLTALAVLSAVLAVLKPLLKFSESIRRLQGLIISYENIDHDMETLAGEIRNEGKYDTELRRQFVKLHQKEKELISMDVLEEPSPRLLEGLMARVIEEFPKDRFFIPGGGDRGEKGAKPPRLSDRPEGEGSTVPAKT